VLRNVGTLPHYTASHLRRTGLDYLHVISMVKGKFVPVLN
jgi:hypothetical protein